MQIDENKGVVTERCRKCRYYGHIGTYECCDYILEARKRRGCAAGDDCNKFEKRKKKGYTPIQNPFAI